MRKLLPFLLVGTGLFAQDMADQLGVVKELMPSAGTVGVLYQASDADIDSDIGAASATLGLRIVKAPIESIRDVSKAIRQLAQYNVSYIYLPSDRLMSSKSAIKFVVKQTVKDGVPVFSSSEDAFSAGAMGRFIQEDGKWVLKINGKVQSLYGIEVPSSPNITVEE